MVKKQCFKIFPTTRISQAFFEVREDAFMTMKTTVRNDVAICVRFGHYLKHSDHLKDELEDHENDE